MRSALLNSGQQDNRPVFLFFLGGGAFPLRIICPFLNRGKNTECTDAEKLHPSLSGSSQGSASSLLLLTASRSFKSSLPPLFLLAQGVSSGSSLGLPTSHCVPPRPSSGWNYPPVNLPTPPHQLCCVCKPHDVLPSPHAQNTALRRTKLLLRS